MGELSLDGSVRPVRGVPPMAHRGAPQQGFKGMIVPRDNATEAAVVDNLAVYGVDRLADVIDFLRGASELRPTVVALHVPNSPVRQDFSTTISPM